VALIALMVGSSRALQPPRTSPSLSSPYRLMYSPLAPLARTESTSLWLQQQNSPGALPRADSTSLDNAPAVSSYAEAGQVDENYEALIMERVDFRSERVRAGLGSHVDASPALVLNADYTPLSHLPLSLWNWQDTLRAVFAGKAVVVAEYTDLWVRSVSCSFRLPSVIALKHYQKVVNKVPVMSRRNVYIRDGFRCQYCGDQFPINALSLDHVVPRAKGGKLTWTNTVSACLSCNYRKGQTSPEDLGKIGMKLRSLPRAPSSSELQFKAKAFKKSLLHPSWMVYIT